jgi:uncharacterized protein (DUF2236 family)
VHGRLQSTVGPFPAGTPYSAEDPSLVLWVHATLLESIPLIYDRVVEPLSRDELDAYCAEAASLAVDLGAHEAEVPRSRDALASYLDRMHASGVLTVGEDARQVAGAVLSPPLAIVMAPLATINRTLTVGLLPPSIRPQYGFAWNPPDQRRLDRTFRLLRLVHNVMPQTLARWRGAL